jgi:hypothetical protein
MGAHGMSGVRLGSEQHHHSIPGDKNVSQIEGDGFLSLHYFSESSPSGYIILDFDVALVRSQARVHLPEW